MYQFYSLARLFLAASFSERFSRRWNVSRFACLTNENHFINYFRFSGSALSTLLLSFYHVNVIPQFGTFLFLSFVLRTKLGWSRKRSHFQANSSYHCWAILLNWTHREIQRKFNTINLNFLGKLRSGNEELAVDRTQPHYIGKELRWKDVIRILSGSAPQINVQSWSAYPHHWCAIWNASGIWIRLSHTSRL